MELEWRLCGGISATSQGWQYAFIDAKESGRIYFLCDRHGDLVARFYEKGRRTESIASASREELEAITGFRVLMLRWQ